MTHLDGIDERAMDVVADFMSAMNPRIPVCRRLEEVLEDGVDDVIGPLSDLVDYSALLRKKL
jgi:hypothetical protein